MESESIEIEDVLEDPEAIRDSKNDETNGRDRELTESELREHYGYELAMSPAETAMPDTSEDPPWFSEDTNEALNEVAEFDLLEPFLLDSERPKQPRKVSELTWFSEDSNDSQTSVQKMFAEEFDKFETSLFSSEGRSKPLEVEMENANNQPLCNDGHIYHSPYSPVDHSYYDWNINWNLYTNSYQSEAPGNPCETTNSATAESPSFGESTLTAQHENYGAETSKLIQALARRMTLGQKTRFYAWFNSGLSVEEAAMKSKIPDLIPPPVRHPSCRLSKKRLRRLSMILPTVYLQRQFVYETYFAGAEPRQFMKYLLADLDSEDLMDKFEKQFSLEELATKEKLLRRNAPAVEQPSDNLSVHEPSQPNFDVSPEKPNSEINPRSDGLMLRIDELKTYYFWRKNGLSISEAISKAKLPGLNQEIVRHVRCKHSWEKLCEVSKALPDENSREKFLVDVYYEGKDPGEVLKVILSTANGCYPSESKVAENKADEVKNVLTKNVKNVGVVGTLVAAAENLMEKPCPQSVRVPGIESDETSFGAEVGTEKSVSWLGGDHCQKSSNKLLASKRKCSSPENDSKHKRERRCSSRMDSITDSKHGAGPPRETPSIDKDSEFPQMSLNQLKKYYKWRNQGFSHDEALAKARTTGLIPKPLSHPLCKHSWEEIKGMSDSILDKHKRLKFQIEVFYGGKNPEDVVKQISSNCQELSSLISNHADSAAPCDSGQNNHGDRIDSITDAEHGASPPRETPSIDKDSEISQMSLNQLKKYYKWCNLGFSHGEALAKARTPFLVPKPVPHPECKHSWEEVRAMSDSILGKHEKLKFQIEVFYGGKNPEVMKRVSLNGHPDSSGSYDGYRNTSPKSLCRDTEPSPIVDSFSSQLDERTKSNRMISNGHSVVCQAQELPQDEDPTTLDKIGTVQMRMCDKRWSQGLTFTEELPMVKIPGQIEGTSLPHPDGKHAWTKLSGTASAFERSNTARDRFLLEMFYGEKDPNELWQHRKTGASESQRTSEPKDRTESILNFVDSGANSKMSSFLQHGQGIDNIASGILDNFQSVIENTASYKIDDSTLNIESNPLLELCNRNLMRYYGWRNKGLSHDEALSKVKRKETKFSTTKEWETFYAIHPNCKHSKRELQQMCLVLPEKWNRDRFVIHTYNGGMDPEHAVKLLKSCTPKIYLPNEVKADGSKCKSKLLRNLEIQYLTGKGMSREEALSVLRNPPMKLMEELEDVILVNCGKKPMPTEYSVLNVDKSVKIPLGSPYHPSKLLNNTQLTDYYLWMSRGLTRGKAFLKVLNVHRASKAMINLHNKKSKYDLEEMNKMSKNLPDEGLAKTFVTETFYGQNDPKEIMKFLSSAADSAKPSPYEQSQGFHRSTTNPRVPFSEVHAANSFHPAEVPSAMAFNSFHPVEAPKSFSPAEVSPNSFQREVPAMAPAFIVDGLHFSDPVLLQANQGQIIYPYVSNTIVDTPTVCAPIQLQAGPAMAYPGYPVMCPPLEQQHYTNDTVDPSKTSFSLGPPQTNRIISEEELPKTKIPSAEDNKLQCYIVPANFPEDVLTYPQMDAIENSILEAILELDDEGAKPTFKESFRSSGRYGIICNDEFSIAWLYKYLNMYQPWEDARLRLITNQSNKITANAVLPLCKDDDEKILKFIEKQNSGLNVGNWMVVHRWDSSDGNTIMDLIIDEESAEILRKCSRISFKFGSAEIVIAKNDSPPSCYGRSSEHKNGHRSPASPPPLPPSPPPPTPPPPEPPLAKEPSIIDTSLGALLKISASKSSVAERPQKIFDSTKKPGHPLYSPEKNRGKSRSRKDGYSRERKRPRSSFVGTGRSLRRYSSPDRIHKRRRPVKDSNRAAFFRSTSRDRACSEKFRRHSKKRKKRDASQSPSVERSGTRDSHRNSHSWLDWFYPADEKRCSERSSSNPKPPRTSISPCSLISSADDLSLLDDVGNTNVEKTEYSRNSKPPPRSTTPCSLISSGDDLSLLDDVGNTSIENMEYAEYLQNSPDPKPPAVLIDLTDST